MKFVDKILEWLNSILEYIVDGFQKLIDFIAKPLSYLFYFFDGVFYFFMVLFDIVVKVVMIFVALFQFIGALIVGFLRTIQDFLTPSFNTSNVNLPSNSSEGLQVVLDLVDPVGLLDIVPYILITFIWGAFIMKIFALFGGSLVAKGGN